jgi:hypothetical protein
MNVLHERHSEEVVVCAQNVGALQRLAKSTRRFLSVDVAIAAKILVVALAN